MRTMSVSGQPLIGRVLISVVASLLLIVASTVAAQAENRGIDRACPADTSDAFDDDEGSIHEDAINCIAHWEIAVGSDGQYNPGGQVTRAQMATFVANLMEVAGYTFAADPPDAFDDDASSVHEPSINRLAAAQVVAGTGERQYSPNRAVTRDQMASFILKALGAVTGSEPQSDDDAFDDDENSVHEASINALASLGVVTGTGDRAYSPTLEVTREAMASFIARAADYLAEQGHWPDLPASGVPMYEVTPDSEAAFSSGQTRTFSVAVEAGTVVDIRLFPTEDVEIAGDAIRFRDDVGPSGRADENVSAAQIIQVDGESVDSAQQVSDVTSDGSIEFVVRSTQDADVTPVVWADPAPADGGNQSLDLLETREPSEAFGVGGRTLFVPGESSAGQSTPTVRTVSTELDLFVSTASITYYYDANDTFQFKGAAISMSEFEEMLSGGDAQPPNKGDVLSVTYQMEPQFVSVFNITEDN